MTRSKFPAPARRAARSGLVAAALLAAFSGCTAKEPRPTPSEQPELAPIDALEYVPADATAIFGLSPKAVYGSWLDRWFTEEKVRILIERARDCGVDVARLEQVVFAWGDEERWTMVLVGPRVGERARLRCISDAYASAGEDAPLRVLDGTEGAGRIELPTFGWAYTVDDRALVLSQDGWSAAVEQLAGGLGKRVGDGPLRPLLDEVDRKRDLWFVVAPEDAAFPLPSMKSLLGAAEVSAGLELELVALSASEDAAHQTAYALREFSEMLPAVLATPPGGEWPRDEDAIQRLRDHIKVSEEGQRATLAITVDRALMELIAARVASVSRRGT